MVRSEKISCAVLFSYRRTGAEGYKMITVDKATNTIFLRQGDTGAITIKPKGYDFGTDDRALFTVKDRKKAVKMERLLPIEENAVVITFAHKDTYEWEPGEYKWDVRWLVGPVYDNQELDDADDVDTPDSGFLLVVMDTVGKF